MAGLQRAVCIVLACAAHLGFGEFTRERVCCVRRDVTNRMCGLLAKLALFTLISL